MRRAAFRFAVVNLGCKVNRVEADGFERLLAGRGGAPSPVAEADLIVVNTCTVTGEAEKKTRKAVRHALFANEEAPVVVTGCATEIDAASYEALGSRVTVVPKAVMALYLEEGAFPSRLPAGGSPLDTRAQRDDHTAEEGELAAPERPAPSTGNRAAGLAAPEGAEAVLPADGRTRIGIKVQDGCDNACTYCIVHVARGRATSRNADEVAAEAVALARAGVREIVLTGINLGSYDADGLDLADLCRRLLAETAELHAPGEPPCRFRIGSVEPMDVSMDLIGLLAEARGRLCRHLHLPLQSGSSKVLREMGRPYDAEEYRQLVDYLRAMVPEIALTTDII
ncbi:radical SAM protein, partial [uncultured Adlercreutzia sp.]